MISFSCPLLLYRSFINYLTPHIKEGNYGRAGMIMKSMEKSPPQEANSHCTVKKFCNVSAVTNILPVKLKGIRKGSTKE
jgi:hypothetical protein